MSVAWEEMKRWERRELARSLRMQGLSYREIAEQIPVAKSTLSLWCRDIALDPEQFARLLLRRPNLSAVRELGAERHRASVARWAAVRAAGTHEAAGLVEDPRWVAGTVAYWSEGAKSSGYILFANSDPDLIRLFMSWAERYLDVTPERFTAKFHLHSGQDEDERLTFWSDVTRIPRSSFRRHT